MLANSLALRLFLSAIACIAVILSGMGLVLSSLYKDAVERAFDRRLDVYLRTLVSDLATAAEDDIDKFPQPLGETMFELPQSGWYWQVTRVDLGKPEVRTSRSLWDQRLPALDPSPPPNSINPRQGYAPGPEDQRLRILEREVDLGEEGRYFVVVAGDSLEIDDEVRLFDRALVFTFAALSLGLMLTTMFQVRFGLAPLTRISQSLKAIRAGSAERLEGKFPVEIAPLAREVNALIETNREIVERARMHVGNLAHALKTPLSVIVNEASARGEDPLAVKLREQAGVMHDQITRHLERARIAARTPVVGAATDVPPVVTALARTMEKIHRERALGIEVEAPNGARFRGERQDLEEMVGNLVDNACKWAQSRVAIAVLPEPAAEPPQIRIVVDDDGRGLTPEEREQVAQRGQRLDESKPGSGLGLSIVVELARLYGGGLTLGSAPGGGLRAELVLPAA